MHVLENHSLKDSNSFGLSVKSRWFTRVASVEELREVIADPRFTKIPKLVLGGGSNILFTRDYDGLVIKNGIIHVEKISEEQDHIVWQAGAGMNWHAFVMHAIGNNCQGLENLSLIPGCVGAAPIQNIGAYGVEMKDTFHRLRAIDLGDGALHTFDATACRFGYRDSVFKNEAKGKYLIAEVSFRLNKNGKLNTSYGAIGEELKKMNISEPTVRDVSDAVIAIRRSKLPDPAVIGNAGSFFKNPEVTTAFFETLKDKFPGLVGYPAGDGRKIAAGWLIEQCGWKGKRIGNCGMHEKQALVLVNYGGATGEELVAHAERVKESVQEKFGVQLETEVNIL
jgi:UDP-N-acetylmuramate dehydrogenase